MPGNRLDSIFGRKVAAAGGTLGGRSGRIPTCVVCTTVLVLCHQWEGVGQMEVLEPQEQEVVWERPKYVEDQRVRMRIGAKGRLVIPAAMREKLGMKDGDVIDLRVVDGELRIATLRERLRRAQEWVKKYVPAGVSLADELSAERREAAQHE